MTALELSASEASVSSTRSHTIHTLQASNLTLQSVKRPRPSDARGKHKQSTYQTASPIRQPTNHHNRKPTQSIDQSIRPQNRPTTSDRQDTPTDRPTSIRQKIQLPSFLPKRKKKTRKKRKKKKTCLSTRSCHPTTQATPTPPS